MIESTCFPQFRSALDYTEVRDFAYHDKHRLHYGTPQNTSIETRRVADDDGKETKEEAQSSRAISIGGRCRAIALFEFVPENDNEIGLVEGQIILVSYRHGQGWLVAENIETGQEGLVPEEYVQLIPDDEDGWYDEDSDPDNFGDADKANLVDPAAFESRMRLDNLGSDVSAEFASKLHSDLHEKADQSSLSESSMERDQDVDSDSNSASEADISDEQTRFTEDHDRSDDEGPDILNDGSKDNTGDTSKSFYANTERTQNGSTNLPTSPDYASSMNDLSSSHDTPDSCSSLGDGHPSSDDICFSFANHDLLMSQNTVLGGNPMFSCENMSITESRKTEAKCVTRLNTQLPLNRDAPLSADTDPFLIATPSGDDFYFEEHMKLTEAVLEPLDVDDLHPARLSTHPYVRQPPLKRSSVQSLTSKELLKYIPDSLVTHSTDFHPFVNSYNSNRSDDSCRVDTQSEMEVAFHFDGAKNLGRVNTPAVRTTDNAMLQASVDEDRQTIEADFLGVSISAGKLLPSLLGETTASTGSQSDQSAKKFVELLGNSGLSNDDVLVTASDDDKTKNDSEDDSFKDIPDVMEVFAINDVEEFLATVA